ncbi:DUF362 domain-containing protein [bacterium]|nr:DUF362 domain-containing protein [bacterium]
MKKESPSQVTSIPVSSEKSSSLSRRQFFKAGGLVTAGFLIDSCMKKQNPLEPASMLSKNADSLLTHPSNGTLSQVATATQTDYDPESLKATIQSCFEAIGGIGDLVKTGDTVGLKLNMTGGEYNAAKTNRLYGLDATETFWSHPEILRAVGELLKDMGAGRLLVFEANYDWASVTDWGYLDVVNALGAEYIDLNSADPYDDFTEVPVDNPLTHWTSYFHNGALYDVDCFVSLPKFKRHQGAGVTGALKNMIGSVPLSKYQKSGAWREKLHCPDSLTDSNSYEGLRNLVRTIVDLNRIRPTHLTVTDAILTADNGEGTWINGFTPLSLNTLIVSKDPVAADSIGTTLFEFDPTAADKEGPFAPDSMPANFAGTDNYLRIADEQGLGNHNPDQIEVIDATVSTLVEA